MKPLVIEFLGTQGSGKTSLLPTVVAFFKEQGVQARTPTEAARPYAKRTWLGKIVSALSPSALREPLLWQVYYRMSMLARLEFNRKYRSLARFVLKTQRSRPNAASVKERRILFWFSHLTGIYTFLNRYACENEALVFDDGFVHRTVHLNASPVENPQKENIIEYLSQIPVPDLLIVPRVPLDVCMERVQRRGVWDHFRDKTQAELRDYMANSECIVNIAVNELERNGCAVVEIDNSDADVQKTITELREKLSQIRFAALPT